MGEELSFKGNDPGATQYGNFINYYKFHPSDTRIKCLPFNIWNSSTADDEHFVALDIGCNCGELTKDLHSFLVNNSNWKNVSILGIDIDPTLILRANEHKNSNISFQCMDITSDSAKSSLQDFLSSIGKHKFDAIFCFSVTMWIHLNYSDDGLFSFLDYISNIGKLLIIEPQPWKCYRTAVRRMKKSAEHFPLYKSLKIRSNVEEEIENKIISTNVFEKIHETTSSIWIRKLLIFENKK